MLNPYLMFDGECEAAFKFYEQCFGGTLNAMMKHSEMPASEKIPEGMDDKIMHACLTIGDRMLMASDCPPGYYSAPAGMYVQFSADSAEEAERIFAALSENGTVQMAIGETFWATRFGMVTDRFGTPWMINFAEKTC